MSWTFNVSEQKYHDQYTKTEAARVQCIHYDPGTEPQLPVDWNVKQICDYQQLVLEERKRRGEA